MSVRGVVVGLRPAVPRSVREHAGHRARDRDSNRLAATGEASERSYARGGGISGAEPDEAGIRTVCDSTCSRGVAALASVSGVSAPSAMTHGIVAAHVPDAGPEQGA